MLRFEVRLESLVEYHPMRYWQVVTVIRTEDAEEADRYLEMYQRASRNNRQMGRVWIETEWGA